MSSRAPRSTKGPGYPEKQDAVVAHELHRPERVLVKEDIMQRMHYLLPGATSLIALTICAPAIADRDINYTYLEANVITRDIDVFDEGESFIDDFDDGSGWGVNGSFLFTDNFFLFGSYSRTESDVTYQSEQVFLIPSEE